MSVTLSRLPCWCVDKSQEAGHGIKNTLLKPRLKGQICIYTSAEKQTCRHLHLEMILFLQPWMSLFILSHVACYRHQYTHIFSCLYWVFFKWVGCKKKKKDKVKHLLFLITLATVPENSWEFFRVFLHVWVQLRYLQVFESACFSDQNFKQLMESKPAVSWSTFLIELQNESIFVAR